MLQRFVGGFLDSPPNKVQEIKLEAYGSLSILQRDDSMILYAPNPNSVNTDKKQFYEITVHRPYSETMNTCFR